MSAGPYVVTVRRPDRDVSCREAFATLEEAQARAGALVIEHGPADRSLKGLVVRAARAQAGAHIALPNGDVVEVEATTPARIFDAIPLRTYPNFDAAVAAWNAEHGIGLEPERRRFTTPNDVKGHPDWYFGLIVRSKDGTQTFDLLHHDDHSRQIPDVVAQPGESKHDAAARAIREHGIGIGGA